MRLIEKISNVATISIVNDSPFLLLTNSAPETNIKHYRVGETIYSRATLILGDNVIFQNKKFGESFVINCEGDMIDTIEEGFNLYSIYKVSESEVLLANQKTKTFWTINENLVKKDLKKYNRINQSFGHELYFAVIKEVKKYLFPSFDEAWSKDIKEYLKEDTDLMNRKMLSCEAKLVIPLKNGQILALNREDGSFAWLYEGYAGGCDVLKDKIYGTAGKYIVEIDAKTGEELKKLEFDDTEHLKGFKAMQNVWAFDDVLVCKYDHYNGSPTNVAVVVLDRKTFELIGIVYPESFIPAYKGKIIWHKNRLYVMDINHFLYVYERD